MSESSMEFARHFESYNLLGVYESSLPQPSHGDSYLRGQIPLFLFLLLVLFRQFFNVLGGQTLTILNHRHGISFRMSPAT